MTLEQIEVQIADFMIKARKVQQRTQQLQRQGFMVAMQSEVAVREKFNEYLEKTRCSERRRSRTDYRRLPRLFEISPPIESPSA